MTSKKVEGVKKSEHVRVFVRARPLQPGEPRGPISLTDREVHAKTKNSRGQSSYAFKRVFGVETEQEDVFAHACRPLVADMLKGFSCTVFAYGQTNSGKTHSMMGDLRSEVGQGLIPRSCKYIFNELLKSKQHFTVRLSCVELYKEEFYDMLTQDDPSQPKRKLKLFQDGSGGTVMKGVEEVVVSSPTDVLSQLEGAIGRRATAATGMNNRSSRSHFIATITVTVKESTLSGEDLFKIGKLHLVDLAGSESAKRADTSGTDRQSEAAAINKSLLTLGRVISSLSSPDRSHTPYRESALTRLLQDALGGKSKTSIITTISLARQNMDETLSTLEYASSARRIENDPEMNLVLSGNQLVSDYESQLVRLRTELIDQRNGTGVFISEERYAMLQARLQELEEDQVLKQGEIAEARARLATVGGEMHALRMWKNHKNLVIAHHQDEEAALRAGLADLRGRDGRLHGAIAARDGAEARNLEAVRGCVEAQTAGLCDAEDTLRSVAASVARVKEQALLTVQRVVGEAHAEAEKATLAVQAAEEATTMCLYVYSLFPPPPHPPCFQGCLSELFFFRAVIPSPPSPPTTRTHSDGLQSEMAASQAAEAAMLKTVSEKATADLEAACEKVTLFPFRFHVFILFLFFLLLSSRLCIVSLLPPNTQSTAAADVSTEATAAAVAQHREQIVTVLSDALSAHAADAASDSAAGAGAVHSLVSRILAQLQTEVVGAVRGQHAVVHAATLDKEESVEEAVCAVRTAARAAADGVAALGAETDAAVASRTTALQGTLEASVEESVAALRGQTAREADSYRSLLMCFSEREKAACAQAAERRAELAAGARRAQREAAEEAAREAARVAAALEASLEAAAAEGASVEAALRAQLQGINAERTEAQARYADALAAHHAAHAGQLGGSVAAARAAQDDVVGGVAASTRAAAARAEEAAAAADEEARRVVAGSAAFREQLRDAAAAHEAALGSDIGGYSTLALASVRDALAQQGEAAAARVEALTTAVDDACGSALGTLHAASAAAGAALAQAAKDATSAVGGAAADVARFVAGPWAAHAASFAARVSAAAGGGADAARGASAEARACVGRAEEAVARHGRDMASGLAEGAADATAGVDAAQCVAGRLRETVAVLGDAVAPHRRGATPSPAREEEQSAAGGRGFDFPAHMLAAAEATPVPGGARVRWSVEPSGAGPCAAPVLAPVAAAESGVEEAAVAMEDEEAPVPAAGGERETVVMVEEDDEGMAVDATTPRRVLSPQAKVYGGTPAKTPLGARHVNTL